VSLPPHIIAMNDQNQAILNQFIEAVRVHVAVCPLTETSPVIPCCGWDVVDAIESMQPPQLSTFALSALHRLATAQTHQQPKGV
jgi:hypothetical protein